MKRFKMKRYKLTNQVAEVDPQGAWCLWEDVKEKLHEVMGEISEHDYAVDFAMEEAFGKEIWDD